jgi:hypothetical protein
MTDDKLTRDDRSQAFTLEGFIASVVILTAVLFALQAIVLTPTTGGTVDQEVRSQLRTQANDILVTTAHNSSPGQPNQNLSYLVRHWNGTETEDTWAGAIDDQVGYGSEQPPTAFGTMLNQSFKQRGRVYNVLIEYRNETNTNESEELRMVYRGVPSDNAIVTTYTIPLYDNDTLTGPDADPDMELWEYDPDAPSDPTTSDYYPIPDAFDGPVYNVIEVRVVVW